MQRVIYTCALAFCLGAVPALAQDAKIKSETTIKADDAKVVSMSGCLEGGPSPSEGTSSNPFFDLDQ